LLLLPLHGKKQEEIKDAENQENRQEAHEGVRWRGLEKKAECHVYEPRRLLGLNGRRAHTLQVFWK
jgi:hypothetical protein